MRILQMIMDDTMTESETTITESGDYVTVTESDEKRIQLQKALLIEVVVRRLNYTD